MGYDQPPCQVGGP